MHRLFSIILLTVLALHAWPVQAFIQHSAEGVILYPQECPESPWLDLIAMDGPYAGSCPFGAQSRYRDSETGLYNFNGRIYEARAYGWLTSDPSGEVGGLNLREFCNSDPINRIDKDGCQGVAVEEVNKDTELDGVDVGTSSGLTAQRIYQDLRVDHNFSGAYDSVKRYARRLSVDNAERVERMECLPGEEAQVDFGLGAPVPVAEC